ITRRNSSRLNAAPTNVSAMSTSSDAQMSRQYDGSVGQVTTDIIPTKSPNQAEPPRVTPVEGRQKEMKHGACHTANGPGDSRFAGQPDPVGHGHAGRRRQWAGWSSLWG